MAKERLYLFDTTLRDGQQTPGVDFSLDDKLAVIELLDKLGVDYIEGGYPGANVTDTEFFREKPKFAGARFTAFGMTKRVGRSVSNDPGFQQILQADCDAICLVAVDEAISDEVLRKVEQLPMVVRANRLRF